MTLTIKEFKGQSVDFKKNVAFNREFFKKKFKDIRCNGNIFLSSDHINSYFLLKENCIEGLIVLDQHIDLWDFEGFNKSNFLKKCLDEKLIKFIVFVGARESEMDYFNFEKNRFDIEFVKTNDFNDGILKAFIILKDKCIKNIAIDIDMDVFNSDIIKGVEYCRENLKNALDARRKYIEKQLNENGLDIEVNPNKLVKYATENDLNIVYWHITEFEPEFDDGRTLELVNRLIKC